MPTLPNDTTLDAGAPTTGTVEDTGQLNAALKALRDFLAQSAVVALNNLAPAANYIAYYTGTATGALAALTAFGRSLIGAADAAAGRTALGLGSLATQSSVGASSLTYTAASRLAGSPSTGPGGSEITVGSGLAMSGTSLVCTVTPGGGGMPDPGSNGFMVRYASASDVARNFANSSTISWTNADGTAGNPFCTVIPGGLDVGQMTGSIPLGSRVTGTLAQANGGTGATTAQAAVTALLAGATVPWHKFTEQATKTSSYTLQASDSGTQINMQASSGVFTVPNGATLGTGFQCRLFALFACTVTGTTSQALIAGQAVDVIVIAGVSCRGPVITLVGA